MLKRTIIVIALLALCACERVETKRQVYHAWMQANEKQQDSLSFDEWVLLYDREMLPGLEDRMASKRAQRAAESAQAMSAAAMSSNAGRK